MNSLFTIGFSGKSAEEFFGLLEQSGANKVIDTRVNRSSQLSGFAKEQDLGYLLGKLSSIEYQVMPDLAPSRELLSLYRRREIDWESYSMRYIDLITERRSIENLSEIEIDGAVLLCSESSPNHCHRSILSRLIVERFTEFIVVDLV
jgi:hypothetical protein